MKKKLLTTVLTVGVVLSLVGCGAKETTSSENVAETVVEVAEETTEYGTEETTGVVEETVVEEQTIETTETVEEIVVEEATENVVEETAGKLPKVFTNDDPDTSTVTLQEGEEGAHLYMWQDNYLIAPWVEIFPGTDKFEECKAMDEYESIGTVTTSEGEKEVIRTSLDLNEEGLKFYAYVYTLGDSSIMLMGGNPEEGMTAEDLQYFVDLIRFE